MSDQRSQGPCPHPISPGQFCDACSGSVCLRCHHAALDIAAGWCGVCRKSLVEDAELRDRFAVAALQGMLAEGVRVRDDETEEDIRAGIVRAAYSLADAMLAERAKGGGGG